MCNGLLVSPFTHYSLYMSNKHVNYQCYSHKFKLNQTPSQLLLCISDTFCKIFLLKCLDYVMKLLFILACLPVSSTSILHGYQTASII